MKIENLILNNYTRMSNRNTNKFEFIPKAKVNIILGSNGMGKSSLLKELLPNTEDTKKEYESGGYKILNFEHNNRYYIISYNRDENKYSFIVDDEELNPSYNMKTFKRLIEETFNLSKEVFNLLIGTDNFTTMSPNERKKWFTEILSDTDYEYGLYIFNKAKIRSRELTGMLKLIESKLLKEYDELKNSKIDKKDIQNQIDYLINVKNNITNNLNKPTPIPNSYNVLVDDINQYETLASIEIDNEVDEKLSKSKNNLENIKTKIETINNQIDQLADALNKSEKIIELEKELMAISKNLKDTNIDESIINSKEQTELYNYITDNYTAIVDIFNSLLEMKSKLSVKELPNLISQAEYNKDKISTIEKAATVIELKLKELDKQKDHNLSCPKCGNIFNPDFDDKEYETLLENYKIKSKDLEELKITTKKLKIDIESLSEKKDVMVELSNYILQNEPFKKLIKAFTKEQKLEQHLKFIYNKFKNYYYMLKDNISNIKLFTRKKEIEEQLAFVKNINKESKDKLETMIKNLSIEKVSILKLLEEENRAYNRLKNVKNRMDKKIKLGLEITKGLKEVHNFKLYKYKDSLYKYNLNIINMINEMIDELKDKLTSVEIRENKIKELEGEKKEYSNRKKATNKIIGALSPSKGLLAKGLVEFINSVIDDMNNVISNIFDYDLNIKPIDLDNGKLDFNFRLLSKGNEISDISKGSSGMREVIDLAFKLVAMNILGMEDYPLILDEFGRALDPVHRSNAYEYINELSNEQFSQVFIVTHNEDVFSRFPNASIVLLDKDHYKIK